MKELVASACVILMVAAACSAEAVEKPTVVVRGSHSIELAPQTVKAVTAVEARGTVLKDVLAELGKRRDEIRKQLEALGVPARGIVFGEPRPRTLSNEQKRQLKMLVRGLQRLKPAKAKADEVWAEMSLTVEQSLKTAPLEEQLLEVFQLETKLKELSKGPAKGAPGEDDEDDDDQRTQVIRNYRGSDSAQPGVVAVTFERKLADRDADAVYNEAFSRARADATRMAKACGCTLGRLIKVTQADGRGEDGDDESLARQLAMRMGSVGVSRKEDVLVGSHLGPIRYREALRVTFELNPR